MNVESYIFQSPSPVRVQVGRPDTSVAKEETDTQAKSDTKKENQTQEVQKPEPLTLKSPNQILDLYV
jgi:hypothetical protein